MSTSVRTQRKEPPSPPASSPRPGNKLKAERVELMLRTIPGWSLTKDGSAISCQFTFLSQAQAVLFAKRVCSLAGRRRHYPEVHLGDGVVTVQLTTSSVDGLSQADFLFARDIQRKV